MMGDEYTIVDMCVWGWARLVPRVIGDTALDGMLNLKRLVDEISARPAAERALSIKGRNGHTFKGKMDEQSDRFMFPQNERLYVLHFLQINHCQRYRQCQYDFQLVYRQKQYP